MFSRILHSKYITALLGLILVAFALNEIYEELFEPTHEHLLVVIGILLVISSLAHLNEGVYQVEHAFAPSKELAWHQRITGFFNRPIVRIILGVTVVVTAGYGLFQDYEKVHSKTVSIGVGVLTSALPLLKAYMGGENVLKGIQKDQEKDS